MVEKYEVVEKLAIVYIANLSNMGSDNEPDTPLFFIRSQFC